MFVRLKLRVKLLFKTVTHLLAQASFGSEMWSWGWGWILEHSVCGSAPFELIALFVPSLNRQVNKSYFLFSTRWVRPGPRPYRLTRSTFRYCTVRVTSMWRPVSRWVRTWRECAEPLVTTKRLDTSPKVCQHCVSSDASWLPRHWFQTGLVSITWLGNAWDFRTWGIIWLT